MNGNLYKITFHQNPRPGGQYYKCSFRFSSHTVSSFPKILPSMAVPGDQQFILHSDGHPDTQASHWNSMQHLSRPQMSQLTANIKSNATVPNQPPHHCYPGFTPTAATGAMHLLKWSIQGNII